MVVDKVSIPIVCAPPDGAVHRALEPCVKVLTNGHVLVIVHDPVDAVGQSFGEFVPDLRPRLAVDHLALRPVLGWNVVACLPAPVLAAGNRPLAIAAPTHCPLPSSIARLDIQSVG